MESEMNGIMLMVAKEEIIEIRKLQTEILYQLKVLNSNSENVVRKYITAIEFMKAIGIGRTKFDELVAEHKIEIVRKKRKIYVHVREIDRYFSDKNIR